MRTPLSLTLALLVAVSGCGRVADSRINPMNWFGGDKEQRVAAQETPETAQRTDSLIAEILELEAAPHPGGVILTARGRAATQGFFDAELVPLGREGSQLLFEFRARAPQNPQPEGAPVTREILAGLFLSRQTIGPATQIVVIAAQNRRTIRQR